MATIESTAVANRDTRQLHSGLQTHEASYTGSISAGDVIQMVPVPHGAIITDVVLVGTPANTSSYVVICGTGVDDNAFLESVSLSASLVARSTLKTGVHYKVSLSDDAVPYFETIDVTCATVASGTGTSSLMLAVTYYMPPA